MRLHFRLWIVFSLIWVIGFSVLYVFIVKLYNERTLANQEQVALSQGYVITDRLSGLLPTFADRAAGYLEYYSDRFGIRLILLSPDKRLTYDSFDQLAPDQQLSLSIFAEEQEGPVTTFLHTAAYGYVQYTLFPIDRRQASGYLLMVEDVNDVHHDMTRFRDQVLILLAAATVGSFVIFYFIAAWFTQPIRLMIRHLQRITPENRKFAMRYRRKDEIGRLVGEMKKMVRQINDYEQRQRRFISTSSHELKTPLSTMRLISENLSSLRQDEQLHQEYIDDLQSQIEKMSRTVQGMLDVYRLADKPLDIRELPVSDVYSYIDRQFQHVMEKRHIQIVHEHDVESIPVDSDLFLRGLDNLISNAIRYSPDRSTVRLSIVRSDDGRVRCSVCDSGIGIASHDLPYVFEPFYRSNEAMGHCPDGSGLGLAIVRQMVDLHRGAIRIESQLGEGTCIHLYFDLSPQVS